MPETGIKVEYVYISIVNHNITGRHVTRPPWALGTKAAGAALQNENQNVSSHREHDRRRDASYPATPTVSGTVIGTGGPRM